MSLTQKQLETQLACLHCGILWGGTPDQVEASCAAPAAPGSSPGNPTTLEQQLSSMPPAEARQIRRRFRKLWRSGARRWGVKQLDKLNSSVKRNFAELEALRLYRLHLAQSAQSTVTSGERGSFSTS